jgi:DNA polymerase-3 subunit epsilon
MTRWWRRSRDSHGLGRPWREIDYVVVDLETTGLNLRRDTIVSYGATVIHQGRMVAARNTYGLVRPECPMSAESITIHALRPTDLATAPPLSRAVDVLHDLINGRVLIAHAAWFETAFLTRAFEECGRRMQSRIIDTAAMARAASLQTASCRGEPDLESMATELHLPVDCPHYALGDAITTAQVFLALAGRLVPRGYETARDFIDLTAGDAQLPR